MDLSIDYFSLFDLPLSFLLDEGKLKTKFYSLSRAYHPDFFTLESAEKQDEIAAFSGYINKAYKTLADQNERIKYILEVKGLLGEGQKQELSPDFLMEMMDINETIFDLQMEVNEKALSNVQKQLVDMESNLEIDLHVAFSDYASGANQEASLEKIKEIYLKSRYLLRIRENISTFAHLDKKSID